MKPPAAPRLGRTLPTDQQLPNAPEPLAQKEACKRQLCRRVPAHLERCEAREVEPAEAGALAQVVALGLDGAEGGAPEAVQLQGQDLALVAAHLLVCCVRFVCALACVRVCAVSTDVQLHPRYQGRGASAQARCGSKQ